MGFSSSIALLYNFSGSHKSPVALLISSCKSKSPLPIEKPQVQLENKMNIIADKNNISYIYLPNNRTFARHLDTGSCNKINNIADYLKFHKLT